MLPLLRICSGVGLFCFLASAVFSQPVCARHALFFGQSGRLLLSLAALSAALFRLAFSARFSLTRLFFLGQFFLSSFFFCFSFFAAFSWFHVHFIGGGVISFFFSFAFGFIGSGFLFFFDFTFCLFSFLLSFFSVELFLQLL